MAKVIKASRATIFLGDIPIEVYQLPDGSYVLSRTDVFQSVQIDMKNYPRFLASSGLKALPCMALDLPQFSNNGGSVKPLSIAQAGIIWNHLACEGNIGAKALSQAALIESIERRADAAFGIQRSEEERNQRFKARVDGIATRRTLTDAIKEYISNHPELSENAVKFMYNNVTDGIYRSLFGRSCKRLTGDLKAEADRASD